MQAVISLSQAAMLLAFVGLLAAGQILLKYVALSLNGDRWSALAQQVITSPVAWAALSLYLFATVAWVLVLRTVPLSIAYCFAALGFVIVPVAAYFLFHEPLSLRYAIGTSLIIAGVILVAGR